MPYTVDEQNEDVKKFLQSVETITGKKPTTSYFSSIGDFCYLGTRVNAPALIFGASG